MTASQRAYVEGLGEAASPPPRRTSWTAPELLSAEFPEPRWAVPGVVAEGLTLFCGAPKAGKSWAAFGLAVAVATGGQALGKIVVESGDALYIALEDPPRRLQARLRKLLGGATAPERLTIATECPRLDAGGVDKIAAWLNTHPDARLVVVDVFAKVRSPSSAQANAYDSDYRAMSLLKALADRFCVAIVVVHHTRKTVAEDWLDSVSGTQGLAGAADAVLILRRSRGQADGELHLTGRDIEETVYALAFAADLGAWQLLDGPAIDYSLGDTRAAILRHLREVGGATPKQIADALGLQHNVVKQRCWQMSKDDQLDTADGRYLPITHNLHNRVTEDHPTGYAGYDGYGTPETEEL
ncbi:MAG: AAA family ATPase [Euzebyales bacterium]|nr:AAA family ATPase [Euzebyales bacterium]